MLLCQTCTVTQVLYPRGHTDASLESHNLTVLRTQERSLSGNLTFALFFFFHFKVKCIYFSLVNLHSVLCPVGSILF